MGAESRTLWYGTCDECGEPDDDGRLTEAEARGRMWPDDKGRELCWDCIERMNLSAASAPSDGEST